MNSVCSFWLQAGTYLLHRHQGRTAVPHPRRSPGPVATMTRTQLCELLESVAESAVLRPRRRIEIS